jgi:hypothetical protein
MADTSAARHPITLKRIVRRLEGMEHVAVTRDVAYHEDLKLDVYHPRRSADQSAPAVVIVAGYPDVGVPLTLGCNLREMEFVVSLAQMIAASGIAAISYSTSAPGRDASRVIEFLARGGAGLHIDPDRLGIWAASGNVPVALALLTERHRGLRAAVLSNGYTFDAGGSTAVEVAAATYRFVNATAGKSVRDLPNDVPMFVVRCGRDENAGLNDALDRFVSDAVRDNLPVTFVNHATAPHAFEVNVDTALSHHILDAMVDFMRFHLAA